MYTAQVSESAHAMRAKSVNQSACIDPGYDPDHSTVITQAYILCRGKAVSIHKILSNEKETWSECLMDPDYTI